MTEAQPKPKKPRRIQFFGSTRDYLKYKPAGMPEPEPPKSTRKRPKFDALNKQAGVPLPLPPKSHLRVFPRQTDFPLPPQSEKTTRYDKVGRPPSPLNRAVLELEPGECREVARAERKVRRTLFRKDALLRRLHPDRTFVTARSPHGTRIWRTS